VISPYVRRLRLAQELRRVRTAAGLTHDGLAKRVGLSRPAVSRLENGHSSDLGDVIKILDALGVEGEQWQQIVDITRQASERGWWESARGMGERQARYADLEAGATRIREYSQTLIPGLLQTPEFARSQTESTITLEPLGGTADGVVAGREGRQRMLRRPGAPSYEVIIDELAIRRLAAPAPVVRQQLQRLATVAAGGGSAITVRILEIGAEIPGYAVPRCTFSLYTYPDPGDPAVVAIDTVTDDVILTAPAEVRPYEQLYTRLAEVALTPDKSLRRISDYADQYADRP
jgi:transcriptional regulator with XRE-family HTH domain